MRWRPNGVAPRWPLTIALLSGLSAALGNLGAAFSDGAWWFVAVSVATVTVVGAVIVRSFVRAVVLSYVGGIVVLLCALTFSFAPMQALLAVIPTGDVFGTFATLAADGVYSINNQSAPADAVPGIVFLLTIGTALLALLIDLIADVAARPALVGLPLLAVLLAPTFFVPGAGDPFFFALTAIAYLAVLYLALGEPRTGGAAGVTALAVVLALLVPLVLPPIVNTVDKRGPLALIVNVGAFVNLGENLRQGDDVEILTYVTDSDHGEYLRLTTIDDFTGRQLGPTPPKTYTNQSLDYIERIPGLDLDKVTERIRVAVAVGSMGGRWLPVPYAPRSVTGADEGWSFEPGTLTITSATQSATGEEYEVVSERPVLSVAALRATGDRVGAGLGESLPNYLTLPTGLADSVSQVAAEVTAGATTNFDRAMALQDYFTEGDFTYSETAPVDDGYDGTSAEAIGLFLEAKSGYCVHFATTMAVMARSLGIPSRLVIGFTPGTFIKANDETPAHYEVTTHNMHAWPELWFDGFGWVRFEPTVSRGELPNFGAAGEAGPTASPTDGPTRAPTASPRPTRTSTPSATPTGAIAPTTGAQTNVTLPIVIVGVLLIGALVVLLLPLLPLARRTVRRAVRWWRVSRTGSAREAWLEIVDTAVDIGWDVSTATPRELALRLRRGAPEPVRAAIARLVVGIEESAYSPVPRQSALDDLRVVRRYTLSRASRRDRIRAFFVPLSVVRSTAKKR